MKPSKCIFVDHDGVICLGSEWGSRTDKQKKWGKRKLSMSLSQIPIQYRFDDFNQETVKVLNRVVEETDAELIVSSDWKNHASLEEMGIYYELQGIVKKPWDYTPFLWQFDPNTNQLFTWKGWLEKIRILEIREFLRLNPNFISWVSVDDLPMGKNQDPENGLENFVLCSEKLGGLSQPGLVDEIVSFLS